MFYYFRVAPMKAIVNANHEAIKLPTMLMPRLVLEIPKCDDVHSELFDLVCSTCNITKLS